VLKILAAALGVLGVLFVAAVFALSYVVLNSTKQPTAARCSPTPAARPSARRRRR
jgi:hypothetical protein